MRLLPPSTLYIECTQLAYNAVDSSDPVIGPLSPSAGALSFTQNTVPVIARVPLTCLPGGVAHWSPTWWDTQIKIPGGVTINTLNFRVMNGDTDLEYTDLELMGANWSVEILMEFADA